ncbi:DUF1003 domain-containing protein [Novosphingobium sp.]|uniref:DUF1003 domain-containing protein n=1 Tax=Novosphingobium sp. TaxID=1874826 RepID=UPI003B524CA8
MIEPDPAAPPPLDDAIELARTSAIMRLRHKEEGSALQHRIDQITAIVGWPGSVLVIGIVMVGWIGFNLVLVLMHAPISDPPPFPVFETLVSTVGLLLVALVLITQRREDELADARAQLVLEMAISIEQKSAKIIALLEEARRDNPVLADRIDHEATAMSVPSDPEVVLEAIKVLRDETT